MTATKKAKKLKDNYKQDYKKMKKHRWSENPMDGKFPNHFGKEYIDIQLSFQWIKHSETEGPITAAQDQALNTRYYNKHIMKEGHTDAGCVIVNQS